MRQKVIRWVSRDDDGNYAMWIKKPKYTIGLKEYEGNAYIPSSLLYGDLFELNLACGGIAKITIERGY